MSITPPKFSPMRKAKLSSDTGRRQHPDLCKSARVPAAPSGEGVVGSPTQHDDPGRTALGDRACLFETCDESSDICPPGCNGRCMATRFCLARVRCGVDAATH